MRILIVLFAFVAICSAAEGAHAHRFFQKLFKGNEEVRHYEGLDDEEIRNHVNRLLESVGKLAQLTQDQKTQDTGCQCVGDTCGCCADFNLPSLKIDATACVNFTYNPQTQNISLTMTYNNKTLLNETVSLHDPPPLCSGLPYVATWCTIFYNITFTPEVRFCLRYELRLLGTTILRIPFGCYTLPSRAGEAMTTVPLPMPAKRVHLANILHRQKLQKEWVIKSHREML
ncbi:uncharacterized protein LOC135502964 [Lineus longissimus]|uniref:uncharacterized protein LOC135502964 n=1 Tax=Lineus longissimus TaxID=88925 RepID=UPI002B4E9A76